MNLTLIFIRAVHIGSCLVFMSVFALLLLVLIPAVNQAGGNAWLEMERLHKRFASMLVASLLLSCISGILWFWFTLAGMTGCTLLESLKPDLFLLLAKTTQFGQLSVLRAGMALLAIAAIFWTLKTRRGLRQASLPLFISTILAVSLAASLAWAGHGGADEGSLRFVHLACDALHLVSAGVWPASLLPFAFFLVLALKSRSSSLLNVVAIATRRFSSASLAAVGLLAASGAVNSYCLVGNMHALLSTDYGFILRIKILVFVAMVCIGAWNLFRLKPQFVINGSTDSTEKRIAAARALTRNVIIEICLGVLVLLLVGWLGITPPVLQP